MKVYPEYKDSGTPWLGKVPVHWEILRNKNELFPKANHIGDNPNNLPLLSLTKKGIIMRNLTSGKGKFSSDERKFLIVEPGDFVFCHYDIQETPRTIGLSSLLGYITGSYNVYGYRGKNRRFFYYLHECFDDGKLLCPLYKGLRNTIQQDRFLSMRICLPPEEEREAIVAYLDKKCAEIDELISRRHAIIERLKELKQSIIVSAVTRGLDPDVPMKDSGIPWLGKIPTHWKTQKFTSKFRLGKGLSINKADLRKSGARVINYGQIHSRMNNGVDVNNVGICYVDSCYIEAFPKALVHLNDILFADTSEDIKGIGNCVRISCNTVFFAGYHTIIASNKVKGNTKYEAYLFQSENWRNQLRMKSNGVKVFSISKKNLRQCYLINPPEGEKEQIVTYLDNKCAEIDALVARQEQIIEKLKELKVSTIAHVVTGKVDVRDAI